MREETIKLFKPFTIAGNRITELTMREPNMGIEEDAAQDAITIGRGNNPICGEMCTFSRLCGVKYEDIRAMPTSDYEKLRAAYQRLCLPLSCEAFLPARDGTQEPNSEPSEKAS